MSVFVSVEDPEGEPLEHPFELVAAHKRFPKDGAFLRYLGEAEDASFNALQTPGLLAELKAMDTSAFGPAEKSEYERLVQVCAKHAGKRKAHLRFYAEGASS